MKYEDRVIFTIAVLLLVAVLFGVSGCAVHRESAASLDSKSASNEEVRAKVDTEIHKVEGPGRTTTTVEEFGPVDPAPADHEDAGVAPPVDRSVRPPHLIRRVTQVKERGPVTTDTHKKAASSAVGASTSTLAAKAKSEKDSKPSLGIPVLGLLIAGIGAAALATHTLWVGPLLTLAKRLLGRG